MRRFGMVAVSLLAMALAGCASGDERSVPPGAAVSPGASASTAATEQPDATGLVGLWRVSDAAGEGVDTWLRLDGVEATLWRDCGYLFGSWAAGEGAFLAELIGGHMACAEGGGIPRLDWLDAAASFERDGDGWMLRADDGEVVARLHVDGAPPHHPDISTEFNEAPNTEGVSFPRLSTPSLPEGLLPATSDELAGRWVSATDPHPEPNLEVEADGSWSASDGCNVTAGRWAAPDPGALLTTSGGSTLIGCEGSSDPSSFAEARAAGFDGDELVLVDPAGDEIGRLVRG